MPSNTDPQRAITAAERQARGASFGPVAGDYIQARPSYPQDAVRWMTGAEPLAVLDVGAGTGKLTEVLVGLGHRVEACEPIAEMAALLAANIPEATVVRGRAEHLPYADRAFDAVTVAQAFHWFDPGPSLEEMARVIAGGGVLCLVWNLRDTSVEWMERMSAIIGSEKIETEEPWREALAASRHFGTLEVAEFHYEQTLTLTELLALVRSRSIWAAGTPEEQGTMLSEMTELIQDTGDIDPDAITLPYKTMAFRANRL